MAILIDEINEIGSEFGVFLRLCRYLDINVQMPNDPDDQYGADKMITPQQCRLRDMGTA
jgi:hypothetical protein